MTEQMDDGTGVRLDPEASHTIAKDVASQTGETQSPFRQGRSETFSVNAKPNHGTETELGGSQPTDADQPVKLRDIRKGQPDRRGETITYIYAVQLDNYAIYKADEVMVHFSDDAEKALAQKKSILPLGSARAEVSSLLQDLPCRDICDRQIANALQLAIDDDLDGAKKITGAARAFVLAMRAARARFQYLKWSYLAAGILMALLLFGRWLYPVTDTKHPEDLLLAGAAGLVGASFSIALAIRRRTVALDPNLLDNVTDGTLRLMIGVISAGVLLLLLSCGILPNLKIGDASFSGGDLRWQVVLVIGFVGGFLERLVPDLLEKRNSQGNGSESSLGFGARS